MCGIAGVMTIDGATPSADVLDKMERALAHRGPDGVGRLTEGGVGLVHTRLAIIDLAGGDQPLQGPQDASLVGNGEIYNYIELNRDLLTDVPRRTDSDFEPVLHLFAREYSSAFARLRGMFALAIVDKQGQELVLSRDVYGIKPLYYCETEGGFAFASEPRALFEAGLLDRSLDTDRRDEIIQRKNTAGRQTIYEGIERLMPGETLTVRDGRIATRDTRPTLPPPAIERRPDIKEAVDALDRTLEESVLIHQRSDVPFGLFLSGGLDSSALLTLMARLKSDPVRAFSIGFTGMGVHDERPEARRLAHAVGADYDEVEYNEEDFIQLMPETVACLDEPTSDPAILPTYKLAKHASHHVKVILSGEGGDEVFAGYARYRRAMRPWWLGGRQPKIKGVLDGLGVLREENQSWRAEAETILLDARKAGGTPIQNAQAADFHNWLHGDLLLKLDRCLMAHGVEGRTPFLDPEVVRFGYTLPDRLKVDRGMGKVLLRHWVAKHCPTTDAFARKKGFDVPVTEWIDRRGAELGKLVSVAAGVAPLCRPDAVQTLFRSHKRNELLAAWSLLYFALWHKIHIECETVNGDLFAMLGKGTAA